jgi:ribonuclease BN (tRNA processing enzyme)
MNNMKLKFIGVGGAFAPLSKGQSNMYFESKNNKRLLLDAGSCLPYIVRDEWGMSHQDFEGVYISHLHADHAGGIEWYALMHNFVPAKYGKPTIYGRSNVLTEGWQKTWRGGLETLEGQVAELGTYFNINRVKQNGYFDWEGYRFRTVQTNHISDGYEFKHSYGLLIQALEEKPNGKLEEVGDVTFITTDTQYCPEQLKKMYDIADLIFHDCETMPFRSGVHAHYDDLVTLPESVRSKMWLYHHAEVREAEADGFRGFVEKGQEFMF